MKWILAFGLALTSVALAEEPTRSRGVYLSFLGDSSPSHLSLNVAHEPSQNIRLSASLGVGMGYAVGVGVKYFLSESTSLRPFVGLNAGVIYSNTISSIIEGLSGFFGVPPAPAAWEVFGLFGPSIGADWKHSSGFNLGFGFNVWVGAPTVLRATILPFVNVGYFF